MSASVLVGAKFMQLLFPAVMEGTSGPCTDRLFVAVLILIFALYVMPLFKWTIKWMMSGADWASDVEMRVLRGDVQENAGAAAKEALYQVFAGKGFWGKRKEMFRAGMLNGWDIVLYLVFAVVLGGLMLAILPGEFAFWAIWSLPVVAYLVVMTQQEDYIVARYLILRTN